jgi:PST family polysaccharide transporter
MGRHSVNHDDRPSIEDVAENRDLAKLATGGIAWQGLSFFTGKGLMLAATVVLARLLTPDDFGLVGLALVFIVFVEGVTDLGAAEALVFLPSDRGSNDAAVTLSVVWSGLLTVSAFLAASLVAGLFHRPEVTPMLRVLSIALLLRGAAEVPDALLRKALRFRRRLGVDLARVAAQGVISICLAVAGAGPWAIVGGYLGANAMWALAAWSMVDYRPGRSAWRLRWDAARPLLAYGVPAAANVVVLSLVFGADYLIVGRVLGTRDLGLYTLAFRVPELLVINVFVALSTVVFPVFSRLRRDPDRLRRGYLTAVRLQSAYGVMAGVGLAAIAPMAVPVAFGAGWTGAIAPLQALALYAAFRSVGIGSVDLYKGMGRPRLALGLSLVRLAAVVPALLVATRFGVAGVAWAQAIVALALAVLMQGVACRVLGIRPRAMGSALLPGLVAGLAVAAGAGCARLLVPGGDVLRLIATTASGAAAGLTGLHLADRRLAAGIRSMVARGPTSDMVAA